MQFVQAVRVCPVFVFCALLASSCTSQGNGGAEVMVFEGARLITGDGSAALESSVFVVENGQFTQVGQLGEVEVPEGATHVDLDGKTVMPAKIDLHGHLCYEDVVDGTTAKANFTRDNCIDHLERYAYMGFSTVVSIADFMEREVFPGDHLEVYQTPRSEVDVPSVGERYLWGDVPIQLHGDIIPNAAQFFTTGTAIASPGGGAQGHEARNDIMYPVSTEEEARRAVRDYVSSFTSRNLELPFIKIWVDDRGGRLETLTPPLYRAVIDEATRLGVPIAAHTVTLESAKQLYRAGMVGAVHIPVRDGEVPDEELLEIIRDLVAQSDRLIWFSEHGNMAALGNEAWEDPVLREMLSPEQVRVLQDRPGFGGGPRTPEAVTNARESSMSTGDVARQLIEAGMIMVLGGDNGSAGRGFGWYEQLRFENWVTMGFTPNDALVFATYNGARALGRDDIGMIDVGRSADFIVLDANPLEDIANTRRINRVYLRGQKVDRDGMRERWQAQWSRAEATE
jgi:imidazolonepropionase-like amidohydrolase